MILKTTPHAQRSQFWQDKQAMLTRKAQAKAMLLAYAIILLSVLIGY